MASKYIYPLEKFRLVNISLRNRSKDNFSDFLSVLTLFLNGIKV